MSALQELLNLGLVDIGSDDSRLEKIQDTATAFAVRLKEEPGLLIPATLLAIDNEADENTPLFIMVEDLLIVEWRTLRNTHVNRPRELLRAIIIDALTTSIEGNPLVAGVVYNTAAGPYKFGQTRLGKSESVIEKLLNRAAHIAETEAVDRAKLLAPVTKKKRARKTSTETPPLKFNGSVKEEELLTYVEGASGPHNEQNEAAKEPNPHWPNTGHPWSYQFAPRMTSALVKAVNLGCQRLAVSISKNLETYLIAVEERLANKVHQAEQLCTSMSESQTSSRLRLDTLWWSEALYSPLHGISYRDLEMPETAVAAPIDLASIVPALSPASVYFVLGETIHRLNSIQGGSTGNTLTSHLNALEKTQVDFGETFQQASESDSDVRVSLLGLIDLVLGGVKPSEQIIRERSGLDGTLELSFGAFAMWVFRDLQAKRLVEEVLHP